MSLHFDNTYLKLPSFLYSKILPERSPNPKFILFNSQLRDQLGLAINQSEQTLSWLCGNEVPEGACSLAMAYAGHQFGHFTMLGDGRAFLLGEILTPEGKRFDLHIKGSGVTPYSRQGDGQASLGPMLREYIVSEAMHSIGIPSTRSLAVIATGRSVWREREFPGAVLVRVASSHIRVGTFEFVAALGDLKVLREFADYVIARHDPDLLNSNKKYLEFFSRVMDRQVSLIAQWMNVGFVHGVMNTDNMAISGETIDYGPCAFLDALEFGKVFSSIDSGGRYAFGRQPRVAQWNLARLAETILPLIDSDVERARASAHEVLESFGGRMQERWRQGMARKLGVTNYQEEDTGLFTTWLEILENTQSDFTNAFRELTLYVMGERTSFVGNFTKDDRFSNWLQRWSTRISRNEFARREEILSLMKSNNPAFIPRNHLIEGALTAALSCQNYQPVQDLNRILGNPYDYGVAECKYHQPGDATWKEYRTFCGT